MWRSDDQSVLSLPPGFDFDVILTPLPADKFIEEEEMFAMDVDEKEEEEENKEEDKKDQVRLGFQYFTCFRRPIARISQFTMSKSRSIQH